MSAAAAPGTPAQLSPVLTEAMAHVKAMLADPTDAAIQARFSARFLSHVPPDKVKDVLTRAHARLGECGEEEATTIKSETSALLRLKCDRGAAAVAISVNRDARHLIEGLVLKPAAP